MKQLRPYFFQEKLISNFITVKNSEYYSNEEKFIFFAVDFTLSGLNNVFQFFMSFKILNVLMMGYFNNRLIVVTYNPFEPKNFINVNTSSANVDNVFPDILINLNGYTYNIIYFDSRPRLSVFEGSVFGIDVFFMKIVAEKQNAVLSLTEEKSLDKDGRTKTLLNFLVNASADVFINTGMII